LKYKPYALPPEALIVERSTDRLLSVLPPKYTAYFEYELQLHDVAPKQQANSITESTNVTHDAFCASGMDTPEKVRTALARTTLSLKLTRELITDGSLTAVKDDTEVVEDATKRERSAVKFAS
jgi:hypothetical protein